MATRSVAALIGAPGVDSDKLGQLIVDVALKADSDGLDAVQCAKPGEAVCRKTAGYTCCLKLRVPIDSLKAEVENRVDVTLTLQPAPSTKRSKEKIVAALKQRFGRERQPDV